MGGGWGLEPSTNPPPTLHQSPGLAPVGSRAMQEKPGHNEDADESGVMPRATALPERPVFDLAGWKSIAAHLGMSRRFAYDAAHRAVDALPVWRVGRSVFASSSELNAWVIAQRRPVAAQPAPLRLVAASG